MDGGGAGSTDAWRAKEQGINEVNHLSNREISREHLDSRLVKQQWQTVAATAPIVVTCMQNTVAIATGWAVPHEDTGLWGKDTNLGGAWVVQDEQLMASVETLLDKGGGAPNGTSRPKDAQPLPQPVTRTGLSGWGDIPAWCPRALLYFKQAAGTTRGSTHLHQRRRDC